MADIQLVLKHGERSNHKYIAKINGRYFYSQDEISKFKKMGKSDKPTPQKLTSEYKKKSRLTASLKQVSPKAVKKGKASLAKMAMQNPSFVQRTMKIVEEQERKKKAKQQLKEYSSLLSKR